MVNWKEIDKRVYERIWDYLHPINFIFAIFVFTMVFFNIFGDDYDYNDPD